MNDSSQPIDIGKLPICDPPPPDRAVAVRELSSVEEVAKEVSKSMTAATARVLEVTEALGGAYAKASMLELTDEVIDALTTPFDDSEIEIRPHDGLIYIPHIHISSRLNRVIKPGRWALVCRRHWLADNVMYGEYVLLIHGCFVGESIGSHRYVPNNVKTDYSDALESTAADALRRICGKRLGIGSQVWEPDYAKQWVARYAYSEHGKWAKKPIQPTAHRAKPAQAKAPAKAPPKDLTAALNAFMERCKAKLVQVAKSNPQNLPYWNQYATDKSWILPTEDIGAILGNPVPVFKLDYNKDIAGNTPAVQEQFLAHEKAVIAMVAEGQDSDLNPEDVDDEELVSIAGTKDASAQGCPNCGHKAVVMSKDYDGILVCQACAWQWDVQTGDYFEEHEWAKTICPIPPKGMPKKQYEEQPMTLGQIARMDHRRFFGLAKNNTEAKGWVGRDGKQRPPSDTDVAFAAACREAVFHMEQSKERDTGEDANPDGVPY